METLKLKRFAQFARRSLLEQVSAKLKLVLAENSDARRESTKVIKKLEEAIKVHGKEQVIERVAYIWFNRFCALRFMDVKRYNRINIVSPSDPGQFQPEILAEAKMGHINEEMVHDKVRQQIFALLEGKAPSRDPQTEAYRLLVVAACNFWNKAMPFLFERIDDYTELLMPEDMLSGNSILTYTREAMTPVACEDVEVIGWLYQFYISEKKDQVFDDLKKNKKITPENIPAATQLFTPHWIVRYLVENSLGRLWMLNRPNSKLIEQMEYYIKPEQPESDFLRINKPEEIKICDPACGSGHMLTYAFDLLYAVYEEEGYEASEIPEKILTHNLYGIEIDERAGELAAFALTMKARARQPRFFRKPIQPNICVLQNVLFDDVELKNYMDFIGRDLFTAPLQTTLKQFEEADNFGSLIRPEVTDVAAMLKILEAKNVSGQLFLSSTHEKVLQALRQADCLSPKYHVVIANPPYMGGKGMNGRLAMWLKDNYEDVKSDLFSAFIVRNMELTLPKGQLGFMSPFVWMFISSYEKLRSLLINQKTITSLVQLEYSGFEGATVPICTFTVENAHRPDFKGGYIRLTDFRGSAIQAPKALEAVNNSDCGWFYRVAATDFRKVPGSPIAYWLPRVIADRFSVSKSISQIGKALTGLQTGNTDLFLRCWWETENRLFGRKVKTRNEAKSTCFRWFQCSKGGDFRKWAGNKQFVVNWYKDGQEIKEKKEQDLAIGKITPNNSKCWNQEYYFRRGISWNMVTSGQAAFREYEDGVVFDISSPTLFLNNDDIDFYGLLSFFNSKICIVIAGALSPTLNFVPGVLSTFPTPVDQELYFSRHIGCIATAIANKDWNAYETSWDFTSLPLLNPDYRQSTLRTTYQKLRAHWQEMTLEMQRLEEENNRIFIEAYGLQVELTPEVPLNEITLTCNPHYRYSNNKNSEELEALMLADTMKEFISYAVGCMLGRYSLDKPGLILANQGETIEEYLKQIPDPIFSADEDNVIPILDGDWFPDDISERFRKFLRVTFGKEHYEENLKFIEVALGKDISKYFLKDFYNDHLRRYKKRPIYWLFSSPKGSFNALIYMHRYRPDTASVVLNGYLREFRTKLLSRKSQLEAVSISASASPGEKTKALKEIESLRKMIEELESYEREVLYPLATEQIAIDLDDGVKVNYQKFGLALKKIPGLDAKEE
jgi:type II restriction/modification system DNA methylase subunit YeeA